MSKDTSKERQKSHDSYESFYAQKRKERIAAAALLLGSVVPIGLAKIAPQGPEPPSPANGAVPGLDEVPKGEKLEDYEILEGKLVRKSDSGETLERGTMPDKSLGTTTTVPDGYDPGVVEFPITEGLNPNPVDGINNHQPIEK